MKYEDILPSIRVGRLARRAEWKKGRCIGGYESECRDKKVLNLVEYSRYDPRSGGGSWHNLQIASDVLAEDWELVPNIAAYDGLYDSFVDALNAIGLNLVHTQAGCSSADADIQKALSMLVHEATEAYRSEDIDRLLQALTYGVSAYACLKARTQNQERR